MKYAGIVQDKHTTPFVLFKDARDIECVDFPFFQPLRHQETKFYPDDVILTLVEFQRISKTEIVLNKPPEQADQKRVEG